MSSKGAETEMNHEASFDLIEETSSQRGELLEEWFTERRSSIAPMSHSPSVPPMGDVEVDPWLK